MTIANTRDDIRRRRAAAVLRILLNGSGTPEATKKNLPATIKADKVTLWRYARDGRVARGPTGRQVCEWLEGHHLQDYLRREGVQDELIHACLAFLAGASDGDLPARETNKTVHSANERSGLDTIDDDMAVRHLFNLAEDAYKAPSELASRWFGYRRSTNKGQIIRYFIDITRPRGSGCFRFRNLFRQASGGWETNGFGFMVDNIIYLLGHATSDSSTHDESLGLRCFALVKYGSYGWYNGIVTSTVDDTEPIAARTVLIPASDHLDYMQSEKTDEDIERMIESRVSPEKLNEIIQVKNKRGKIIFDAERGCSKHVQALLWNGTFTTIRAEFPRLHRNNQADIDRLIEFQNDGLELTRTTGDGFAPLSRLAEALKSPRRRRAPKKQRRGRK